MNIFTIPKNASQTLINIRNVASGSNIDVVVVREPFDRFISAAKTVHPQHGIFGGFPPTFKNMPWRTGSFEGDVSPEEFIDHAIENLGQVVYLQPQMQIIGNLKFDEVLKFDTLVEDLTHIIEKYNIKISGDGVLDIHHHRSPHYLDERMFEYARNKYDKIIREYFADDYAMYEQPQILLK